MGFFDCHCHLEHALFEKDASEVIQRAKKNKTRFITHGCNLESNRKTLALADGETAFAACGLDAFHSGEGLPANMAFLEKNKANIVAVGEIGLDQHYFGPEHLGRQKEVFEAQLKFAEKNRLPAVIHTRNAIPEVLSTLPSYECTKVLHFFLEKKHASEAIQQGCFLSLPTLKSKARTAIIKSAPIDRLLTETDSPYGLAAAGEGQKPARNEPSNVREAYEAISDALGKPLSEVQAQLLKNAETVFRI